jgi:hypothetical protein
MSMKIKSIDNLEAISIVTEDGEIYLRYEEECWWKCQGDLDSLVTDEEKIENLEKAYQEYLK